MQTSVQHLLAESTPGPDPRTIKGPENTPSKLPLHDISDGIVIVLPDLVPRRRWSLYDAWRCLLYFILWLKALFFAVMALYLSYEAVIVVFIGVTRPMALAEWVLDLKRSFRTMLALGMIACELLPALTCVSVADRMDELSNHPPAAQLITTIAWALAMFRPTRHVSSLSLHGPLRILK